MDGFKAASAVVFALALSVPAAGQTPLPEDLARPGGAPVESAPVEASPAEAAPAGQLQPPPGRPLPTDIVGVPNRVDDGGGNVFKLVASDFKRFFSRDTAQVMSFFAVAGAATAPWDREGVNNGFGIPTSVFEAGNIAGSFAFQVGAGLATYGAGRAFGGGKLADVGRDIVRAQILSQVLVQGMKITIQRDRPDHSNSMSFPSGHSASAFATAGVLHRHYGWKVGVPAYAFGSYVALARMAWNRHHATDVVMGAGFGLASARTVTMSVAGSRFRMGVQPQAGGASINFSKIYQ